MSRETTGDGETPSTGATAGASAGGTSGTAGTGAGGTDFGGTAGTGVSGTGSVSGTGGTSDVCIYLNLGYVDALANAKTCDPSQSGPRCEYLYPSSLPCGCGTFANQSSEVEAYEAKWSENGCLQPPCPPCPSPPGAYCSEAGRCEDTAQPRCDGGVSRSPICDYGTPCTDARHCLHGDCYVPGGRENPICSRYCTEASDCPAGAACIEVGGEGSHCFVRCTSDELCTSINPAPENPLSCISFGSERVCIQRSEP